jgi:hypothetical protein
VEHQGNNPGPTRDIKSPGRPGALAREKALSPSSLARPLRRRRDCAPPVMSQQCESVEKAPGQDSRSAITQASLPPSPASPLSRLTPGTAQKAARADRADKGASAPCSKRRPRISSAATAEAPNQGRRKQQQRARAAHAPRAQTAHSSPSRAPARTASSGRGTRGLARKEPPPPSRNPPAPAPSRLCRDRERQRGGKGSATRPPLKDGRPSPRDSRAPSHGARHARTPGGQGHSRGKRRCRPHHRPAPYAGTVTARNPPRPSNAGPWPKTPGGWGLSISQRKRPQPGSLTPAATSTKGSGGIEDP